ncbi:hypothetical protein ACFY1P_08205 [Streptomyces sp. NPDC001407]|uniref:phage terminase small subunit n=1 Tax=Streptomyces sp. NPDC001407 TaxID=3364573 RepID=UPI0036C7A206
MRRNKRAEIELTGQRVKAPVLRNGDRYSQETLDWWMTWINSPQAEAFLATDWERLQMLAVLVNDYYLKPTVGKMAEIRQNETLLGATVLDRKKTLMKGQDGRFLTAENNPQEQAPSVSDEELYGMLNGGL